jgi:hypothetical protein
MAKLLVGAALSHDLETERCQQTMNFLRLKDRCLRHRLSDDDLLCSDEVRMKNRLTIFEQHCNDFAKILTQLVQGFPLGVRTWKTRNVPNEQACVCATFND